ncbi:fungal-specific transcription factor domain-containing protein [Mycena olivaceomarginata]|nr:fungal-specific transcription factor domain-containing protein [Mycena olivaceomarginata]
MSDNGRLTRSHSPTGSIPVRQRRPLRSCDFCRQRKSRGDGQNMPDGHCSNCLAFGYACTYIEPPKKRGRKPNVVDELRSEIASLKAQLRSLSVCRMCAQPLCGPSSTASVFPHNSPESDIKPAMESEDSLEELASRFSQFDLDEWKTNYFGSASSFALTDHAIAMKEMHDGRPFLLHSRRPLFWDPLPWEKEAYDHRPKYVYPPSDLIDSLLHLYFTNVHPTVSVLHRPSFERSVADGLHLTDTKFGGLLLSVLATAARYSKDSRVFVDGDVSKLSAGWEFVNQIWILPKVFEPTIYEVQMYCLLTMYTCGLSTPQNGWLYLGIGIRCLHHRGVHRQKPSGHKWNPEDELWKRAFWSFLVLERMVCAFMGRPMSLQVEEYDVEHPLEVDDEYWDQGFTQPPGKPSQLAYLVCDLRLCEIWGDAIRRLYASKKSKILMGWDGSEWEQRTVANFDSTMNDFLDFHPPASPPQGVFFDQSVLLHVTYNYILIAIHRPYIHKETILSATSLSICANAARIILRTADIWFKKLQRIPLPSLINAVFVSGLILALNIMAAKRAGLSVDKNRDMALVATSVQLLKVAESRSQPVGRLVDLLMQVLAFDSPLPLNSKHPPKLNNDIVDAAADKRGVTVTESESSIEYPSPFVADVPNGFYAPPFEPADTSAQSPSPGPIPGMTIEQLLAVDTTKGNWEDELMSLWMVVPTDAANISGGWDPNMWFSDSGAPQ